MPTDVDLRRELTRLIETYSLEVGTVLSPPDYATSYQQAFNAGARAALSRAVNDMKEALR